MAASKLSGAWEDEQRSMVVRDNRESASSPFSFFGLENIEGVFYWK